MWTYNDIRITVVDLKEQDEQTIVKLQPIDAGTVYQVFGHINNVINLQCLVVGSGDVNALKDLIDDGTPYSLEFNEASLGNFYLDKLTTQWTSSYGQTFRIDKSYTDLVFKVIMELSKE
jgi:hypothetical protein